MKKPYTRLTLPNGLRVIFAPQKENVAATALVLVSTGSKYETKEINGLSHFLEHMCFKGTAKRPKAIQISSALDGMGAEYNAFTSQEWTGYYAKVAAPKIYDALELVSDLYLNPIFEKAEMEKEKGVVIEEINMYEDLPPRRVGEFFNTLLYGDQPAGWDIGGKKEVIRSLTREQLVAYRDQHYVAAGTIIVIAGGFDPKRALADIKKHFAGVSRGKKHGKIKTVEKQEKPELFVKYKESDQSHLIIGCRAFSLFDKRRFALEVLADILGGGMSSRLFEKVRNELGAAYYVRAGVELASDHGSLSVAAGVDHAKLEIVSKAIITELKRFTTEKVSKEELERSKSHLSGRLLLGLEGSDAIANYYGGQEVVGEKLQTPKDLLKNIQAVTAEDIMRVAKFFVSDKKLNMALIGPMKEAAPLKDFLHF